MKNPAGVNYIEHLNLSTCPTASTAISSKYGIAKKKNGTSHTGVEKDITGEQWPSIRECR